MKYFLVSTIYDEAGNHIALASKRELDSEEVIGLLKGALDQSNRGEDTQAARPQREKVAHTKVAAKAAPTDGKTRCAECGKPKRHSKSCSMREVPAAKETTVAASKRGISPEVRKRIEDLARAGKNVNEIIAAPGVGVSIPTVRRVCRDASIELVSSRKAKAIDESEEQPAPAQSSKKEPHPLDVRTLLTRGEYGDVKTRHFQKDQKLGEIYWYYKKNGMDELRRAVDSQNYDEYKKD